MAEQSKANRSEAAKKAAATRRRNAAKDSGAEAKASTRRAVHAATDAAKEAREKQTLKHLSKSTDNVGDFTRLAAEHSTSGAHHHGVLIALSSRFARRPSGIGPLIAAVRAIAGDQIADRVVYLNRAEPG